MANSYMCHTEVGYLLFIVGDKTIAVLGGKSSKGILGEEGFVTQDS